MNVRDPIDYHQCLWEWYANPAFAGYMKKHLQALCQERLPTIFGYYAIHLGYPIGIDWMKQSPIKHRLCICPQLMAHCHDSFVCGKYEEVPAKTDSIDLVLMPHTLEAIPNPETVVQEAYRVLIPDGSLLLMGFNGYRYRGLKKSVFNTRRSQLKREELPNFTKLKKILVENDFNIIQSQTMLHFPQWLGHQRTTSLGFLEKICQYIAPQWGSVYIIYAKKKVPTLTPIIPNWKQQKFLLKDQVSEPTTRGLNRERCD